MRKRYRGRDEHGGPDPDARAEDELRIVVLMRHAEAQGFSGGGDRARELTPAGRGVAAQVGRWLGEQGVRPDAVVVSPATRTRQTWEGLQAAGLSAGHTWIDKALYDADPEDIVESLQTVPDEAHAVVVIGHAPGIPFLAGSLPLRLAEHSETPERGWPPAAVAVVSHRGSWAAFPSEDTAIVAFHRP